MQNILNITEFEWDKYTFYIRPMEPFTALELLGDLQRLILPAIGDAVGTEDVEVVKQMSFAELLSKTNIDFGKGIKTFSDAVPGRLLKTHVTTILNPEYIGVKMPDIDEPVKLDKARQTIIFSGHILGMLALTRKVLEVNFADFFTTTDAVSGVIKAVLVNQQNCPENSVPT